MFNRFPDKTQSRRITVRNDMKIDYQDIIYLGVIITTICLLAFIPSRIIKMLRKIYVGEITDKSTKEQKIKNRVFSTIAVVLMIPYGLFFCPFMIYCVIIITEFIIKGKVDWR